LREQRRRVRRERGGEEYTQEAGDRSHRTSTTQMTISGQLQR
jgi:hypothetical protein